MSSLWSAMIARVTIPVTAGTAPRMPVVARLAVLARHPGGRDAEHNGAKASMDEIHRHLLLVRKDRDAQATDHQPDVQARTDVTQPVPSGSQRMGTNANDGYDVTDFAEAASANADGTDDNGLTATGQGIYRKLCAKGVAPKVPMAMARRAQNVKPGAQLANRDFSGPGAAVEMAYQQAAQRQAEDAARPLRRQAAPAVSPKTGWRTPWTGSGAARTR
jgi:hypothetical protein